MLADMTATMSDMSLEAAAAHYGISTRTLHRWIAAGRVSATRVGGRVRVSGDFPQMADTLADSVDPATDMADGLADVADTAADTSANGPGAGPIIALLEAEVVDLRARCDAHQQAEAELRRLLALALQPRALPSGVLNSTPDADASPAANAAPARPWYRCWRAWWRR